MADLTPLQAIRLRLALPVGENAVFDGWTAAAVNSAAGQLGVGRRLGSIHSALLDSA